MYQQFSEEKSDVIQIKKALQTVFDSSSTPCRYISCRLVKACFIVLSDIGTCAFVTGLLKHEAHIAGIIEHGQNDCKPIVA